MARSSSSARCMSGWSAGGTRLLLATRSSHATLASFGSSIRCRVLARFSSECSVLGSSGPKVRSLTSRMRLRRADDSVQPHLEQRGGQVRAGRHGVLALAGTLLFVAVDGPLEEPA